MTLVVKDRGFLQQLAAGGRGRWHVVVNPKAEKLVSCVGDRGRLGLWRGEVQRKSRRGGNNGAQATPRGNGTSHTPDRSAKTDALAHRVDLRAVVVTHFRKGDGVCWDCWGLLSLQRFTCQHGFIKGVVNDEEEGE